MLTSRTMRRQDQLLGQTARQPRRVALSLAKYTRLGKDLSQVSIPRDELIIS